MNTKIKSMSKSMPLYFVFAILVIFVIAYKADYHGDEIMSYGLANNEGSISIEFEEGVRYEPAVLPYLNYMTVDKNSRFNYSNVWKNQSQDVHPPLWYAILHTICSLTPHVFSRWQAGIINLIFGLLTLYYARKLIMVLTDQKAVLNILSISFILASGILSSISFLRMYVAAMFFVTVLSYLIIHQIGGKFNFSFYLFYLTIIVFGALTHYYCIIFSVMISSAYGVYLIFAKKWKDVFALCIAAIMAGFLVYMIFPAIVQHIFYGYRGVESIHNFTNTEDYWTRLKYFFNDLSANLYGSLLGYILVTLFFVLCVAARLYLSNEHFQRELVSQNEKITGIRYLVLIIPCILYFLLISKIAVLMTIRYFYPIFTVAFIGIYCLVCSGFRYFLSERACLITMCVLMAIVTVQCWTKVEWEYLYISNRPFLDSAPSYSDVDCICIYNGATWILQDEFSELSNYNSLTIFNSGVEKQMISDMIMTDTVIITLIHMNDKDYLEGLLEALPQFTQYNIMGSTGYGTSYIFY